MNIYSDRRAVEYLSNLKNKLSLWNESGEPIKGGLIDTAIPLSNPKKINGVVYKKRIKVDFVGLAATTLFDKGGNYTKAPVVEKIEEIVRSAEKINALGIQIKFRILFVYPYSTFAFSFIQAENSTNRSSVEDEKEIPFLNLTRQIDETDFWSSNFVRSQKYSLEYIQELVDRYKWFPFHKEEEKDIESGKMLIVRFTPINPSLCGLVVNDKVYYDSYQFSKDNRYERKLSLALPLVELSKFNEFGDVNSSYKYVLDHFRYLWRHDLTMDHEDVTNYIAFKKNSLASIKYFTEINFKFKADRLTQIVKGMDSSIAHIELESWRRRIARLLNKFCIETEKVSGKEVIFISCCWNKWDTQKPAPLKEAMLVDKWLKNDFKPTKGDALIQSKIVIAENKDFLSRQIYNALAESTLGIIFLTNDIPNAIKKESGIDEPELVEIGKEYFSKPNIYHELGYLSRQLDFEKLMILRQEEDDYQAHIPTNISDLVKNRFQKGKIALQYLEIIKWLSAVDVISPKQAIKAVTNHAERLKKYGAERKKEEALTKKEIASEIEQIEAYIKSLHKVPYKYFEEE
ncbi:MAG: hypothetical protein AAFO02_17305 [Bacteroidota bacterium]